MSYTKQPGMDGYTGGLTSRECQAMTLLYDDGWTTRELSMVFEVSKVSYHINGKCNHE